MKKISIFFFYTIIAFCIINYSVLAGASDVSVDPDVLIVSSGPVCEDCLDGRIRFRVVVTLSEISMNIFVQQIEYGEENCCKKVIKTFEIDPMKLEGPYNLFLVEEVEWVSHDSVKFKGNSTYYIIEDLGESYKVIRK